MGFIIYPQENYKLAVVYPVAGMSIDDVIKKSIPKNTPYKVIDDLNIYSPFFDAYEYDEKIGVKFNSIKAKNIQKQKWRKSRELIFSKLDFDYMRSLEDGDFDLQKSIISKKKKLRDITLIEIMATTPEEIAATWPDILGPQPI